MSGSYVGAASQTLGGDTLLLYAIAAAVIGGTSLFGGRVASGRPCSAARYRDLRGHAGYPDGSSCHLVVLC
jgi:hypothetical protein